MYSEITSEAFDILTGKGTATTVDNSELASKQYWKAHGVTLLAVYNYVSNVEQYYIQDINSWLFFSLFFFLQLVGY